MECGNSLLNGGFLLGVLNINDGMYNMKYNIKLGYNSNEMQLVSNTLMNIYHGEMFSSHWYTKFTWEHGPYFVVGTSWYTYRRLKIETSIGSWCVHQYDRIYHLVI